MLNICARVVKAWLGWSYGCYAFSESRISATQDGEVNNCISIYHTSWIISGPKRYFMCDKRSKISKSLVPAARRWIILANLFRINQSETRKAQFACVVHANNYDIQAVVLLLLLKKCISFMFKSFWFDFLHQLSSTLKNRKKNLRNLIRS